MAKNAGQVKNLKPFVKGDPRIKHNGSKGRIRFDMLMVNALTFKTPAKLRARVLKRTGRDAITWDDAVMAVLIAQAAEGSARHIEILYKLTGAFARAEAEAKKEVEREGGDGETGSTLLIRVVRKTELPTEPMRDITPENAENAT